MLADAEKYKAQDEEIRKKVAVGRELDELHMRIDERGSSQAKAEAADIMEWLAHNLSNLSISDLEEKQKEMVRLARC